MGMWTRFTGILGFVIFLFGVLGVLVTNSFAVPLIFLHLVGGLLLMIVWFFLVGVKNLDRAGEVFTGRSTRFGVNVALYTVVFVGILIAVNWFAVRYNKRWDLTEERVYSLATQSDSILKGLQKPLKIVVMAKVDAPDKRFVADQLDRFVDANKAKVSYEIVDPRAKPHLVEKYQMKQGNLVYLQYGEGDDAGVSRINDITEESLTNAILKLTRGDAKKVYFVQGHGEPEIENGTEPSGLKKFAGGLSDDHLTAASVFLAQSDKVPADAAAVILVSPKQPLKPEEREQLIKYAEGGGHLFLLGDPRTTSDVKEIAAHFGMKVNDDLVIDQVQRLFAGPALGAQPLVNNYGAHPITSGLSKEMRTMFNLASTVTAARPPAEGETFVELAKTAPSAWAETDLAAVLDADEPSAERGDADTAGPVNLGMVYEKKLEAPKDAAAKEDGVKETKSVRVVVFGDGDWVQNFMFDEFANRDLALNSVNWLVGEEATVAIGQRSMKRSTAAIPMNVLVQLMAVSFVIPELILVFGLFVWWKRRAVSV